LSYYQSSSRVRSNNDHRIQLITKHQAVLLLQAPLAHASQTAATLGQFSSKAQAPARSTVRAMASASNGADVPAGKEMAVLVRLAPFM
jgi:hypothetical protein